MPARVQTQPIRLQSILWICGPIWLWCNSLMWERIAQNSESPFSHFQCIHMWLREEWGAGGRMHLSPPGCWLQVVFGSSPNVTESFLSFGNEALSTGAARQPNMFPPPPKLIKFKVPYIRWWLFGTSSTRTWVISGENLFMLHPSCAALHWTDACYGTVSALTGDLQIMSLSLMLTMPHMHCRPLAFTKAVSTPWI